MFFYIAAPLAVLGIAGYGLAYMVGGPATANRYARQTGRYLRQATEWLGRTAGQFAQRHPLAAGVVIVIVILWIVFR